MNKAPNKLTGKTGGRTSNLLRTLRALKTGNRMPKEILQREVLILSKSILHIRFLDLFPIIPILIQCLNKRLTHNTCPNSIDHFSCEPIVQGIWGTLYTSYLSEKYAVGVEALGRPVQALGRVVLESDTARGSSSLGRLHHLRLRERKKGWEREVSICDGCLSACVTTSIQVKCTHYSLWNFPMTPYVRLS